VNTGTSLSAIWEEKHQQKKTLKKNVTNRYIDGGGVWWHDRILIAIQLFAADAP
jgi:hypothetical protein